MAKWRLAGWTNPLAKLVNVKEQGEMVPEEKLVAPMSIEHTTRGLGNGLSLARVLRNRMSTDD
jgi:hypothetical protein